MLHFAPTIQEGDCVILYENFENQTPIKVKKMAQHQNRFGSFPHDSLIGLPFGSKVSEGSSSHFAFFTTDLRPGLRQKINCLGAGSRSHARALDGIVTTPHADSVSD